MPIKLSIVFLNYNRIQETRITVEHLKKLTAGRADMEVIAVDNASSDGTAEYLTSQRHWLTPVLMPDNSGIAGYNQGFEQARGEYLLVLDDDSHPRDSATLERLIAHLDDNPRTGIVACRIESPAGKPVQSWHLPADLAHPGPSPLFIACGFIIRREVFAQAGWYPGTFFLYQNEMEVAVQVRRQGYSIDYRPDCTVIHRESPISRPGWRRVYYPTRNTLWLIRRYFPWHAGLYMMFSRLCFGLIRAFQARAWGWYFKAVKEGFFTPVERVEPPPDSRLTLQAFRDNNSLWHHLKKENSYAHPL